SANPFILENAKLEIGTTSTDWTPAPEDQATVDWTKAQLDIKDTKISAAVTGLKSDIATATAGMATQTWTQGKLDLTADGLTSQISSVKEGLTTQYTQLQQTLASVQLTANNAVTQSQYTQLADSINLRVQKGDVVNQINISPEGILIDGQKVHITGQTTIDNAVIKDAMIADIKADKITAGTLNAANVNVINLNANNITTGTLKGANLSMNLNTGEILFQKGSIRSTDGKLNMRINDGSMSLTNSSGDGVYFKDGVMALTDSNFWTNQSHIKYGEISFDTSIFTGATSIVGAALRGNSGVIVGTSNFVPNLYLGPAMTSVKGGGIGVSKDRAYMASEGIASVVGGVSYESLWWTLQPAVMVGVGSSYTSGSIWQADTTKAGNGTFIEGHIVGLTSDSKEEIMKPSKTSDLALASDGTSGYVLSMSVYGRTYSSGAGMTVTPNGVLGRISSASKYKLAIGEISTLNDEAHQFLSVKPKQWFDKSESEALADTMTTGNTDYIDDVKALPHTGFIAEDLYTAGLDSYVIRGNDGSIESIQYDRLPVLHHELIRELFNRLDAAEMEIYKLKQEVINNAN
uniref:gp58-like family protein n=1 Tax=Latilactobacillus sakei TaxID=1599 RepID=UPI003F534EFA